MPETLANLVGAAASVAAVRGTLVFLAALLVTLLARRLPGETRHVVWLAVLASFLLIPLAWLAVPAVPLNTGISRGPVADWRLAVAPVMSRGDYAEALSRATIDPLRTVSGPTMASRLVPLALVAAWVFGAAAFSARVIGGAARLRGFVREAFPDRRIASRAAQAAARLAIKTRIRVLCSAGCRMPFSFGILRPSIMLPAHAGSWSAGRLDAVLTHELAHVRRRDLLVQSIGYAVCVVYWFLPPAWLAYRALLREAESCCDRVVLSRGFLRTSYARSILEIAVSAVGRAVLPCTSTALGKKTMLADRLRRLLELRPRKQPFRLKDAARVMALCLCCLLPVLGVFGTAQRQQLPGNDPLHGTWVNAGSDASPRFETAKVVILPDGHKLMYRHIADSRPYAECWNTVEKEWVDAEGRRWYLFKEVWDSPDSSACQGYSLKRVSRDGRTLESVFAQESRPQQLGPLGPSYWVGYRQD